jgi:hypothetical protein
MSDSALAPARQLLDGFKNGDPEHALAALHPDCVVHQADSLPYHGDWVGPEGFAKLIGVLTSSFELTINSYDASADDQGLVTVRAQATFRSHKSGRSLDMQVVELYQVRDGLIVEGDIFYKDTHLIRQLADEEPA